MQLLLLASVFAVAGRGSWADHIPTRVFAGDGYTDVEFEGSRESTKRYDRRTPDVADKIHDTDRIVLSLSDTGESRDQQVLEALALLVALREWTSHWTNRRVQLSVRSDNMAALAMVCRMQPHSEQWASSHAKWPWTPAGPASQASLTRPRMR